MMYCPKCGEYCDCTIENMVYESTLNTPTEKAVEGMFDKLRDDAWKQVVLGDLEEICG